MSPLLAGVSHLMQTVEIHALRTMKEGMSIFSVLVAGPGSGKSGGLRLIRRTMKEIEQYLTISREMSHLVNRNFL